MLFLGLLAYAAAPAAAGVPDEVDQAVRRASDAFKAVQSFRVEVQTTVGTTPSDGRQPLVSAYAVAMQRPNKGAFILKPGQPSPTYVCDGTRFTTFMPGLNQYTIAEAPSEIDGIFQHTKINSLSMGCYFAKVLMIRSPYDSFMKDIRGGKNEGVEAVMGASCRRVRLMREGSDLELWIAEGERPLLMRARTVGTRKPPTANPNARVLQPQIDCVYSKWEIDPALPEEAFAFTPPQDARRVDAFSSSSPQDAVGLDKKK
jgi:hypothetical protein